MPRRLDDLIRNQGNLFDKPALRLELGGHITQAARDRALAEVLNLDDGNPYSLTSRMHERRPRDMNCAEVEAIDTPAERARSMANRWRESPFGESVDPAAVTCRVFEPEAMRIPARPRMLPGKLGNTNLDVVLCCSGFLHEARKRVYSLPGNNAEQR